MQEYGEYIYDGGDLVPGARILLVPDGVLNLDALRQIMFVGQRAMFELALSENSLKEVHDRERQDYLQWAFEVLDYWHGCLSAYGRGDLNPFSGHGQSLAQLVMKSGFGYLSDKDRALLHDALLLECQAFLTIDRRLAKNAPHIARETGLRVLEPFQYWELLKPWAPLFV